MKAFSGSDFTDRLRINSLFTVILLLLFSSGLTAQKSKTGTTITGTVTDASLYPVANAIVLIDGQKSNALTNSDGRYKVRVKKDASMIGILTSDIGFMEIPIDGMTRINFQFSNKVPIYSDFLKNDSCGEEVNIGYNSIKKKHLTSQIKKINGTASNEVPYSNIYEMIEDNVAGVRVNGTDIVIPSSQYYINPVPPLLVVDGTSVSSLSGIPPSIVESISVLKSAAATIFGTRGYGGAIIVTTKPGH